MAALAKMVAQAFNRTAIVSQIGPSFDGVMSNIACGESISANGAIGTFGKEIKIFDSVLFAGKKGKHTLACALPDLPP